MNQLTIIGGGATGLVSAYLAAREGWKVTIVEAQNELGGLLATFPTRGDPIEYFYHHFFTHDAEILWLLNELGIKDSIFFKETIMGVFRDKKIFNFTTPVDLLGFKPLPLIDRARFAATSLALSRMGSWRSHENTTALEWFYQWAGKKVTEVLWKPMLEIKFGRYANEVPLAWMIGRLQQRMASRKQGKEQLGYIFGSLKVLVDALKNKLEALGVEILTNEPLEAIETDNKKIVKLVTRSGKELPCQKVLSTIPAPLFASLIKGSWDSYRNSLNDIKYFGAICCILWMKKPLSHVYWLNVADPGYPFGGIIEHTNFVAPNHYGNEHIAYLSRYIELDHELATKPVEDIGKEWVALLPNIYPNFKTEDLIDVKVFRTRTAATVCDRNFSKRVPEVQSPIEGLYVMNMAHIYPDERSVNNSIRLAANFCSLLGINHSVPKGKSLSGQIGFANAT